MHEPGLMKLCLAAFICICLVWVQANGAKAITEDRLKCLACHAVAAELQRRLEAEVPHSVIDMRNRLDSQGNRYGKRIDFKVSELRLVQLLDGLCEDVKDQHELHQLNSTRRAVEWQWVKVKGSGRRQAFDSVAKVEQPELKTRQRQLLNWCSRILEEHEEELASFIQAAEESQTGLSQRSEICQRMTKYCPAGQRSERAAEARSEL